MVDSSRNARIAQAIASAFDNPAQAEAFALNNGHGLALALVIYPATALDLAFDLGNDITRVLDLGRRIGYVRNLASSFGHVLGCRLVLALARPLYFGRGRLIDDHRSVRAVARAADRSLTRAVARASVRDLDRQITYARDRALDFTRALDLARQVGYVRDLASARRLARVLAHSGQFAHTLSSDRILARDRARDLERALIRDRDREPAYTHDRELTLALDLALDHARELARALGIALQIADNVAHASDLARTISTACHQVSSLIDGLGRDLSGADISHAHLADADLYGVLWSARTSWPQEMLEEVLARSTEIELGVFRVDDGGRRNAEANMQPAAG